MFDFVSVKIVSIKSSMKIDIQIYNQTGKIGNRVSMFNSMGHASFFVFVGIRVSHNLSLLYICTCIVFLVLYSLYEVFFILFPCWCPSLSLQILFCNIVMFWCHITHSCWKSFLIFVLHLYFKICKLDPSFVLQLKKSRCNLSWLEINQFMWFSIGICYNE